MTQPVLYNLLTDEGESQGVAQVNPEVVQQMLALTEGAGEEFGEFMQRGKAQRPAGSIYPNAPVVSHEKDWGQVPADVVRDLKAERTRRYATFATGKWPWLGYMEDAEAWGFDEMVTWRNYNTADRYWDPNLYVNGDLKAFPGEYGPDVMQDSIFAFIDKVGKESPGKPFFVYYPSALPHGPMVHTPDSTSADISKAEKYRDMVLYMDKQVGDLRERLERRNLAHNTLIIFTGDNGSNAPVKEIPIDPATSAETQAAYDKLNAALAELARRGGFVSPWSKP